MPPPTPVPSEAAPPGDIQAPTPADLSAAGLLERGFTMFRDERPGEAGAAFRAAIATGSLNDAGRTLAYWHIFLAERGLGHVEGGADALMSFLAAGQDVLDARGRRASEVLDDTGEFIERFDLKSRMARARAILSAIWVDRRPSFGRSPQKPVPVRSESEISYFLEMVPPCAEAADRLASSRRVLQRADAEVERVDVRCNGQRDGAAYFFERAREDE